MKKQRTINNLLVTGGAGFIGSAFIRYILTKVNEFKGRCVNLDLLTYAGNLANLREVENDSRYYFHKGNICDQSLVEKLCWQHNIDAIIHFAAESHVDRSITGPMTFLETNVLGTFHLLEVIRRNPQIHFHHVSTDEVYGCLGDKGVFTEETSYHPNSPYSASKASSDHFVRAYATTYKLSTCISNCSNNYGPYQFPEKLIPLMILNCLNGRNLPVYGKGQNIRDWLYVDDHAKALWMLLEYSQKGETYNIGGEEEWKNIDLIHGIIKVIAKLQNVDKIRFEQLITYVQDRPGHDFRYAIDCTKIKREIGWMQDHTFTQGLEETVKWYLNNHLFFNVLKHVVEKNSQMPSMAAADNP
jgi:dTDP-glucose 4,6-dehydratase